MSRRRAIVFIGAETMERMLSLPPGQRVVSVHADWLRDGCGFVVEGEGLEPVEEGIEPPRLGPEGYADPNLRAKLEALLERYSEERDGPDAGDLHGILVKTLTGDFDPRIEMPASATATL